MRYTWTCDGGLWHCEMLNYGHEIWLWISVINTLCDNTYAMSCELYNNPTTVYLEKSVYTRGVKRKVYDSKLGTWGVKL